MLHYLCIACEVLARPIYYFAANSPHSIDIELIRRGLHNDPAGLQVSLQDRIITAEGKGYSAILLAYGLCGNGSNGLRAQSIPIVVPRVHDCIGMYLGSRERYKEQFELSPGTYWFTHDSFERKDEFGNLLSMGLITDTEKGEKLAEFTIKYGEENAQYLLSVMETWQSNYTRLVYMESDISKDEQAKSDLNLEANKRGWTFETLSADLILFRKLLHNEWERPDPDFIVVPPGKTLQASFNDCNFKENDEE